MRGNEKGDAWTNGWLKFIYNLICLGLLIIIFRVKGVPIYQQSLGLNFWWFYDALGGLLQDFGGSVVNNHGDLFLSKDRVVGRQPWEASAFFET